MMFHLAAPVAVAGIAVLLSVKLFRWRRNHHTSKLAGFPVFLSPVFIGDIWWMLSYPFLVPVLEYLPAAWVKPWLSSSQVWQVWKKGYQPFAEAGSDSFMLSSPNGNILWTADLAVIHDLLLQSSKVHMPADLVGFFGILGPTVGTVNGEEWKTHRRAVSYGFSTSIYPTVWTETQRQVQTLIEHWTIAENSVIPVIHRWTARLALHVISRGFFNTVLNWDDPRPKSLEEVDMNVGLSLGQSLPLMLRRLATVFLTPRSLLDTLPFRMFREGSLALSETERHIWKQRSDTQDNIGEVMQKRHLGILEAIVVAGTDPKITDQAPFMKKSIFGNMFFLLLAGHETVGSALGSICILTAFYPDVRHKIQAQLDRQLGDRPPSEWSSESDFSALHRGYIGAVQKEVLSIYHPASFFLRRVAEQVTVIDAEGVSHVIPAGTVAALNVSASTKNPKLWHRPEVSAERKANLSDSPALYFNPDRWIGEDGLVHESYLIKEGTRLVPSWWGFGQGPRVCLGRAFAQIEMTAAMATLFKDYSLELVVDDATLEECNGDELLAWERTRDNGIRMMYDDIKANITISLSSRLPLRLVKRSEVKRTMLYGRMGQ